MQPTENTVGRARHHSLSLTYKRTHGNITPHTLHAHTTLLCARGEQTKIVLHYLGLSALYTFNNQLSFYCLELADPGSMSLGKSVCSSHAEHTQSTHAEHRARV